MWTICQDFLAVSGSVSLFKEKLEAVFKTEMLIHPANMLLHTDDRGKHSSNAPSKALEGWTHWSLI